MSKILVAEGVKIAGSETFITGILNPFLGGGRGQIEPWNAKISEKCLCPPHNTAFITQIPMLDIVLVITIT